MLPDGTAVPITIGDYRQLSDALFHAGTDSGSEFEYVDEANRLHFYVLDVQRDRARRAVLHRRGPVPRRRRTAAARREAAADGGRADQRRLGEMQVPPAQHRQGVGPRRPAPEDVSGQLRSDVYRLSAKTDSRGWSVWLPNQLATAEFGKTVNVTVYAKRESGHRLAAVRLTAKSESEPAKTDTATCVALAR